MKKQLLFIAVLSIYGIKLIAQNIIGIDVSAVQGTIDWSQVSASKTFAFVKATKGQCYTDSKFSANMAGASGAGVIVGAYHFALPDDDTATVEAQYFLNTANSYIGCGYL